MSGQTRISARQTASLLLVAVAWALFLAATGSPAAILFTIPVFLLAGPLAFGCYAGEKLITAMREEPRAATSSPLPLAEIPLFGNSVSPLRSVAPVRGPPAPAC